MLSVPARCLCVALKVKVKRMDLQGTTFLAALSLLLQRSFFLAGRDGVGLLPE